MATLVDTLAAVAALLAPLVADGTLAKVASGPQDVKVELPLAEVRFGPAQIGRQQDAGLNERQQARFGVVRVYSQRLQGLGTETARFPPIIDAIEAAFRDAPDLNGVAQNFDATGNSGPIAYERDDNLLYVEIGWSMRDWEADTYVQDY